MTSSTASFDPRVLKAPHPVPGAPDNWKRFFSFNTDAKVIGIQYIATSLFFLLVGGVLAMIMRGELITPPSDLVDPTVYNGLYTMHGTVMLFLFLFPILNGFNNLLIPPMIGAPDMAFPRLNAAAFWLVPLFGVILMASFFVPGGPASTGWWSYPPASLQNPVGHLINGESLWILAVALSGISSIMGAVNFTTTILRMRAPGMGFFRMPIFCWTAAAAQTIQLVGLPALTGGAIMLLFDLCLGTTFFRPEGGGDPVLYQHFFWFYSHPAVYVMVLPVFGIFSEIFPVYARKPLFGYPVVAIASFAITGLSLIVWVHHMFYSGTPMWMRNLFMYTTMLIAVPTGIKVFAWLGTLWRGRLRLTTPMLFCLGGVFNFIFAGITGIMLATVPVDIHVGNTYFVVGHFHYVIFSTITFGVFAGIYHWFPKFTGRMPYEGLGLLHFWLTFIGSTLNFLPMHWAGLMGMPRRVASYDPEFAFANVLASLGAFLLGVATIPFLLNMVSSWSRGRRAPANPWQAIGLEWLLPSPPPAENFEENVPTVISGPYGYGLGRPLVEHEESFIARAAQPAASPTSDPA
ncbi:cytochrome c oxidase subunit I [Synechococcus sp. RSCCF101]|uniref:cytochrome c oxidase subunit I n=1 Tax=Synechococcus sp. RSCCF101 TaxID=2511069 RepID=UPI001244F2E5|nr:cbb3-type cytochrome c oxidase subunit I [Synechococcus sp. RSCCF101]QEY31302.1 cytochrome c oxidase subunit I [Synechococcus sp. RSCCF101]